MVACRDKMLKKRKQSCAITIQYKMRKKGFVIHLAVHNGKNQPRYEDGASSLQGCKNTAIFLTYKWGHSQLPTAFEESIIKFMDR